MWAHSRTLPAGDVFRAKLILLLADGMTYEQIITALGTTKPTIARWKARCEEAGMEGLQPRHKGSQPRAATLRFRRVWHGVYSRSHRTAVLTGRAVGWRLTLG